MAPHVTAEIWERRFADELSVASPALARCGPGTRDARYRHHGRPDKRQVRSRIEIALNTSEAEAEALALSDRTIVEALGGAAVKRVGGTTAAAGQRHRLNWRIALRSTHQTSIHA